jgi:hypothetical protein
MNISIIPSELVQLASLDDTQFMKRAQEIADFIMLFEGDIHRGAFADAARARIVSDYAKGHPKIRQTVMQAGAAVIHEATTHRSKQVVDAIKPMFGNSLMKALESWYEVRALRPPRADEFTTLVKAPGFDPDL